MTVEPNDPKIEKLLEPLRAVPPRDRLAAVQGRGRFLAQAATLRNTQPVPKRQARLAMLFSPSFLYRKENFAVVATIIVVLALLFGGTAGTAYAAQSSLPGEILYPVKTLIEDVRLDLTKDSDQQYALLDQFLTTRFAEMDEMKAQGIPLNAQFANRLLLQLDQMLALAASQSDDKMVENLDHLYLRIMDQDRLSWYDDDLEGEVYGLGLQLREEITTRAQMMVEGTEDPIEFRLELQNRTQTNLPLEIPPDAPVNTPGGSGPGEPANEPQGTTSGTGSGTPLKSTPQPYYYFPGKGGLGTGQKGR